MKKKEKNEVRTVQSDPGPYSVNAIRAKLRLTTRDARVQKLVDRWVEELSEPDADPLTFLLTKFAEMEIDAKDAKLK